MISTDERMTSSWVLVQNPVASELQLFCFVIPVKDMPDLSYSNLWSCFTSSLWISQPQQHAKSWAISLKTLAFDSVSASHTNDSNAAMMLLSIRTGMILESYNITLIILWICIS